MSILFAVFKSFWSLAMKRIGELVLQPEEFHSTGLDSPHLLLSALWCSESLNCRKSLQCGVDSLIIQAEHNRLLQNIWIHKPDWTCCYRCGGPNLTFYDNSQVLCMSLRQERERERTFFCSTNNNNRHKWNPVWSPTVMKTVASQPISYWKHKAIKL